MRGAAVGDIGLVIVVVRGSAEDEDGPETVTASSTRTGRVLNPWIVCWKVMVRTVFPAASLTTMAERPRSRAAAVEVFLTKETDPPLKVMVSG